ncbi:MAG: hypothetical protein Q9213_007819 [Squamulea squamosa]
MFEAPSITQAGAIRMVSNANAESGSLSSARYANERYINKDDPFIIPQGRTPSEVSPATPRKSANSTSTVRMPSHENVTTRSVAPMAKLSSSNLRPGNDNSSRVKDLAPAASFSRLRISEDDSSSYVSRSKPSMESHVPRRDVPTSSNDATTFSYGSPRTPVGRVRLTPLNLRSGSGRRANDENTPLNLAATGDDGKSTLSASRYV